MRWKILVAAGLLVASLVTAAIIAACSSGPSCAPGTMLLNIALLDTSPLADTITVVANDPGAMINESFPHTPNASNPGVEHTSVVVTFPDGYPKDTVLHLIVRAIGGTTILGANTASIRLDTTCTVGDIAVRGGGLPTSDMGPMTD
jgi:hypothetical protein